MTNEYSPIVWKDNKLLLLDQRLLPHTEKFVEITDLAGTVLAIKDMIVRGAPCIGFTAIFGMALWVRHQKQLSVALCRAACDEMISARPTAVNLSYEVNRCFDQMKAGIHNKHTGIFSISYFSIVLISLSKNFEQAFNLDSSKNIKSSKLVKKYNGQNHNEAL